MYKKKIAVRAMTAIAAGALLASNVMVAGAAGTDKNHSTELVLEETKPDNDTEVESKAPTDEDENDVSEETGDTAKDEAASDGASDTTGATGEEGGVINTEADSTESSESAGADVNPTEEETTKAEEDNQQATVLRAPAKKNVAAKEVANVVAKDGNETVERITVKLGDDNVTESENGGYVVDLSEFKKKVAAKGYDVTVITDELQVTAEEFEDGGRKVSIQVTKTVAAKEVATVVAKDGEETVESITAKIDDKNVTKSEEGMYMVDLSELKKAVAAKGYDVTSIPDVLTVTEEEVEQGGRLVSFEVTKTVAAKEVANIVAKDGEETVESITAKVDDKNVTKSEEGMYMVDLSELKKAVAAKGYDVTSIPDVLTVTEEEVEQGGRLVSFEVTKTVAAKVVANVVAKDDEETVESITAKIDDKNVTQSEEGVYMVDLSELKKAVEAKGYDVTSIPDVLTVTAAEVEQGGRLVSFEVKKSEEPAPAEKVKITVNFVDKDGNSIPGKDSIVWVDRDAARVTADQLKALLPDDYELASDADLTIKDNAVTVKLEKTKTDDGNHGNGGGGSHSGGSSGGSGSRVGAAYGSSVLTNGNWHQLDDQRWEYNFTDGTKARNGWYVLSWQDRDDWYYFDADGYLVSGWYTDANGVKYYLHAQHDGTFGRMYTGWNKVDGAWQHFNDNTEQGVYGAWEQGAPVPAELANL